MEDRTDRGLHELICVCVCVTCEYIIYQSDVALEVHVLTTNEGGDR